MDCREAQEFLDAYALDALDDDEARAVRAHLSDCLRCWGELNKAERTAALLALSAPIREAPARVGRRLMAQAERERGTREVRVASGPFWRRLRWQTASLALAAVSVAALSFAAFLQFQMNDLRDDKGALDKEVAAASSQLDQQRQVLAIVSAADAQKVPMSPRSLQGNASVSYTWSGAARKGFLSCQNLPPLSQGQVYEVWFTDNQDTAHPAANFVTENGGCEVTMDLSWLHSRPGGIGLTVEQSANPTGQPASWLMYASFSGE